MLEQSEELAEQLMCNSSRYRQLARLAAERINEFDELNSVINEDVGDVPRKNYMDTTSKQKIDITKQAIDTGNGHGMDLSFIQKPHHWDPRRLYSQTACDWQQRVDFDRLRKDRLATLRDAMTAQDLGALVLFAGANIRYATGSYQGNWKYNINIRYVRGAQRRRPGSV